MLDSDTLKSGGGPNSRTARLGTEGQKVLGDVKEVLRALKAWGEEKNDNDLLQNFFVSALWVYKPIGRIIDTSSTTQLRPMLMLISTLLLLLLRRNFLKMLREPSTLYELLLH